MHPGTLGCVHISCKQEEYSATHRPTLALKGCEQMPPPMCLSPSLFAGTSTALPIDMHKQLHSKPWLHHSCQADPSLSLDPFPSSMRTPACCEGGGPRQPHRTERVRPLMSRGARASGVAATPTQELLSTKLLTPCTCAFVLLRAPPASGRGRPVVLSGRKGPVGCWKGGQVQQL